MAGIKPLRKIQMGKETTSGTAVAATALWRGKGTMEDQREVVFVEEDVGYISGLDRTNTPKYLAAIEFEEIPATFEQLPYILAAGVKNVITGATDGAGTDKIYTYTFPTTSKNTITTFTIEGGDDQEEEEITRIDELPGLAPAVLDALKANGVELIEDFIALRSPWTVAREETLILLGPTAFLPDFTFRHRDGTEVLLEIVGFWTPEYLSRKREILRRFRRHRILLALPARSLRAGAEQGGGASQRRHKCHMPDSFHGTSTAPFCADINCPSASLTTSRTE